MFFELLIVTVLSVSHLVAFIQVTRAIHTPLRSGICYGGNRFKIHFIRPFRSENFNFLILRQKKSRFHIRKFMNFLRKSSLFFQYKVEKYTMFLYRIFSHFRTCGEKSYRTEILNFFAKIHINRSYKKRM